MFQEQKHITTTIPPDPRVVQYRSFRWIYWLIFLWMILYAFIQFTAHGFNVAALPFWDILLCLLMLLSALLWVIVLPYQQRRFRRLALRRQAAVGGDASLLAVPQPVPDAFALPLPFTVNALPRASTRAMVALGIIFGVVISLTDCNDWVSHCFKPGRSLIRSSCEYPGISYYCGHCRSYCGAAGGICETEHVQTEDHIYRTWNYADRFIISGSQHFLA